MSFLPVLKKQGHMKVTLRYEFRTVLDGSCWLGLKGVLETLHCH